VRLIAAGLVVVGVVVVVLVALVALVAAPAALLLVGVVLLLALLVGTAVLRRTDVVELDEGGYRVRAVRGCGVRQARWTEVEDVSAVTLRDEPCVVLRLRDGRTTSIPVLLLAGRTDDFVLDLQQHLNRGHGYRRLPGRA
jgi:hypothetical protein